MLILTLSFYSEYWNDQHDGYFAVSKKFYCSLEIVIQQRLVLILLKNDWANVVSGK